MSQVGSRLSNRYTIIAFLEQGGMSAVYLAHDARLDVQCVIKELQLPANALHGPVNDAIRSFEAEAKTLARLKHSGIPRVTDYFSDGTSYYLVMDVIDGVDLSKRIGGGVPEIDVLRYADELLDILAYVHGQGVVHRDVKPENVVVRHGDNKVFLVDFGISKTSQAPTMAFAKGLGTPPYAPPEQYFGSTDARSDVYALAATLYHAATGQKPVDAVARRAGTELVDPCSVKPHLSSSTNSAILCGMALEPASRFQTAMEFRASLGLRSPSTKLGLPLVGAGSLIVAFVCVFVAVAVAAMTIAAASVPVATPTASASIVAPDSTSADALVERMTVVVVTATPNGVVGASVAPELPAPMPTSTTRRAQTATPAPTSTRFSPATEPATATRPAPSATRPARESSGWFFAPHPDVPIRSLRRERVELGVFQSGLAVWFSGANTTYVLPNASVVSSSRGSLRDVTNAPDVMMRLGLQLSSRSYLACAGHTEMGSTVRAYITTIDGRVLTWAVVGGAFTTWSFLSGVDVLGCN